MLCSIAEWGRKEIFMKLFLKNHLFLVLILSVIAADVVMWQMKFTPSEWIEYTYNGVFVTLLILELLIPRDSSWNYFTRKGIKFREIAVEIFFFYWSGYFASVGTYAFSNWAATHIRDHYQLTTTMPLHWALQAIIVVLGIDFLRYWLHRWMHEHPFLWRFHALHHMPERLGTATSTRTHPVDDFLLYVPEMILLFTLGFDRTLVAALYSVIWVISLIKHANIEFAENRFSKHFQMPTYHLIHHKYQDENAPTYNFSEVLTVWDKIFGTFRADPITNDHRVGVSTDKPRGFIKEFFGWLVLPIGRM
jgi:sterol desaturase/sphingolipid hydroxylase (fatty acid hydroxylase superfamily)